MLKDIYKYLLICFGTILVLSQSNAARIMDKNLLKENWRCEVVDNDWKCERVNKNTNIFDKKLSPEQKEQALANDLDWIFKPSYFPGGYYNNDHEFTKDLCKSKKTELSYENAEYDTNGDLIASGNVEILQCDQELYSDNVIIDFNANKNSISSLVMIGNVTTKQPSTGMVIRTQNLGINVNDGTYSAGATYFRLAKEIPNTRMYDKENFSRHLRGYAEIFKKEDSDNLIIENGYITFCDPADNDWKISGRNININTKEAMVYIKDGFFEIKDIPVMHVPYFSYPIGKQRRTGFLRPSIVNNELAGYGLSVPYYFNLATNYDLLLESIFWFQRGLMENVTFKYMTEYFQGQFEGSMMLYDFKTHATRGAFQYSNKGNFKNGITTSFKYDYVSDKDYYSDFSAENLNLVTKTLLDRKFDLNYSNSIINSGITVVYYGIVNPSMRLANKPYAKLPEIKLSAIADNYTPDYLSLSIETLNTFFYKTKVKNSTNVNAFRTYESPKITGNFSKTWGYFNPSLELPMRYYKLNNTPTNSIKFNKSNVVSIIPIFNIDSGLYFDRHYATKYGSYVQTLQPRLFYTYIPYQNQTNIPLFDTSLQNEQYMQMFQVNRFTGHDRINNANQLTYALESTIVNKEGGTTLASAKIGQMMYFSNRKVTLCQGNSKCQNPEMMDIFAKEIFSPIMSSFEYKIIDNIFLSAQINYRIQKNNIDYQSYQLSYKDKNENIFNVSYNNVAHNWNALTQDQINNGEKPKPQETVALSTIINFTSQWGVATLLNYNFQQAKVTNAFVGIQHNNKSWAIRALWQGSAYTSINPNNLKKSNPFVNSYILEFELKGLGRAYNQPEFENLKGAYDSGMSSQLNRINGYKPSKWGDNIFSINTNKWQ